MSAPVEQTIPGLDLAESAHRAFGLFAIFVAKDALGRTLWAAGAGQGITLEEPSRRTLRAIGKQLGAVRSDVPLRLIHVLESEERTLVVTEGPKGPSFAALRASGELEPAARVAVAADLAAAVHELHQESVVGLTLSDETVFLVNGAVRISLLEALVRRRDEESAKSLGIRGADERYAAPELRRSPVQTIASDVHAVARLAWELLGGALSSTKRSLGEGTGKEEGLPSLGAGVDEKLVTRALRRGMDATATLRQPTARELAADLRAALRAPVGAEDVAPPDAPVRRLTKRLAPLGLAMMGVALAAVALADKPDVVPGTSVPRPARVKILAEPWADVFVNGERLDTTPIGRPVELPPGRYELSFRHPSAPEERRTLDLASGASVTVDVVMQIPTAVPTVVDETP